MQFGMALSDAFLDTIIYFPPKGVCLESKMADEQAMIRRLLHNSLVSIIRELASEILDSDRIDSLYYRIDWLYHTTVRYLDTGIIDARIVRCLREAKDCLYRSRSGSLSTSLQAQKTFTGERGRPVFDILKEQLEFLTEKVHCWRNGSTVWCEQAYIRKAFKRVWAQCESKLCSLDRCRVRCHS